MVSGFSGSRARIRSLRRSLTPAVAAGVLAAGLIAGASPASATPATALYAYAGGTASSPASCPLTTVVTAQCSLSEALGLVSAGGEVLLATAGANGPYYGNFVVSTPSTSASSPVTVAAAKGIAGPILDGDGSGAVTCPTASCDGAVVTVGAGVYANLKSLTIQDGDNLSTDYASDDGGGLDDGGTTHLTSVTVTNATAFLGGGAFAGNYASLTVTNSTFSDDTSSFDGGGIASGDDENTGTLTVTGSTFTNDASTLRGGAIASGDDDGNGTLTVTGSAFSDDTSVHGGAIETGGAAGSSTATVTGSTFSTDTGFDDGGAIDSGGSDGNGTLTVTGSTFTDDSSPFGGAIDSGESNGVGKLTVTKSAFSGDMASTDGGAIDSGDSYGTGTLTITASTFANDSAGYDGGGVDNGDNHGYGTAAITASTFADDSSLDGGAIDNGDVGGGGTTSIVTTTIDGNGGNASVNDPNGSVIVAASIVADSTGADCAGPVTDGGFNLEDDATASCGFSSAEHDLVGISPALGPLQNNGGPTETLQPSSTSPVLDQIPDPTKVTIGSAAVRLCLVQDQRGDVVPKWTGCAVGSVDVANLQLPIVGAHGTGLTPASGGASGYTPVTIKGVNFTGVTAVTFGGVNAAYTVVSAEKILAMSPGGAAGSTVTVTVTASGGTSPWRPSAQFTYN
jgi:hypothetical protein